ncbi:hypothetical protein ACROYT_G033642 [Oculina patagonica]
MASSVQMTSSSSAISVPQSSPSPPLIRASSVPAPPTSPQLSFSISRILGLDEASVQSQSDTRLLDCGDSNTESSIGNANYKSRQSSDNSPSVDSDNPSTDVDSGRESDDTGRSAPNSAERPRKKKQRTTFSPIEVWELEKVFAQRPYLMPEDEDELVQKLGLTARNIRFWFQNRRAKLRRQERSTAARPQTCLPNQFDRSPLPPSASYSDLHFRNPFYPANVGLRGPPQFPSPAGYSPRNLPAYPPEETPCPCCPIQSNRFESVDMDFPPNQEDNLPSRLRHSAKSPAFVEKLPRTYANQFRKMSDKRENSRDYLLQGLSGIREYCNGDYSKQ